MSGFNVERVFHFFFLPQRERTHAHAVSSGSFIEHFKCARACSKREQIDTERTRCAHDLADARKQPTRKTQRGGISGVCRLFESERAWCSFAPHLLWLREMPCGNPPMIYHP